MEDDGLGEFDFSSPLQFALSRLNGTAYHPTDDEVLSQMMLDVAEGREQEQDPYSNFPKPSSLSRIAEDEQAVIPRTTNEIIDELVENYDNYPKLVQIMMQRGFLKKKQECRKCDRMMHLRRRKNSYEWRCRTRDKRGDCSSCSIKNGSWFEATKLPLKTILTFLTMHCNNCSSNYIGNSLKLSTHTISELRKVTYDLSDRISAKYSMIGGYQKEVFLEIIVIASQKFTGFTGYSPEFTILAGQEFDSKLCFAKVLPDQNLATIEEFKRQNISVGSLVTQVVTVDDQALGFASQNPKYLDESTLPHSTMFFASLRTSLPEYVTVSAKVLQMYLNDQVVRRVEDSRMMEKCVEELKSYLQN